MEFIRAAETDINNIMSIIKQAQAYFKEQGINQWQNNYHEENIAMQKLLEKNKFKYCGIIYLEDGNKRIAFEKILY